MLGQEAALALQEIDHVKNLNLMDGSVFRGLWLYVVEADHHLQAKVLHL
jgi:hypothetical protein